MSERYGYRYRTPRPAGRTCTGIETLLPRESDRLLFVCRRIDALANELAELRFERENWLQKARGRARKRRRSSSSPAPTTP